MQEQEEKKAPHLCVLMTKNQPVMSGVIMAVLWRAAASLTSFRKVLTMPAKLARLTAPGMDVCTACTAPNHAALAADGATPAAAWPAAAPAAAAAAVLLAESLRLLELLILPPSCAAAACTSTRHRTAHTVQHTQVGVHPHPNGIPLDVQEVHAGTLRLLVQHVAASRAFVLHQLLCCLAAYVKCLQCRCSGVPPTLSACKHLQRLTAGSGHLLVGRTCCWAVASTLRHSLLLTLSFVRLLALPPGLSSRRWSNAVPYTQPSASVAGLLTMHQPWSPSLRGCPLPGHSTGSKHASDHPGTVLGMKGTTNASRLQ